jgi:hypothetical protein
MSACLQTSAYCEVRHEHGTDEDRIERRLKFKPLGLPARHDFTWPVRVTPVCKVLRVGVARGCKELPFPLQSKLSSWINGDEN